MARKTIKQLIPTLDWVKLVFPNMSEAGQAQMTQDIERAKRG